MNKLAKLYGFLAIPLLSVLFLSCNDDEEVVDPLVPVVTAVAPVQGIVGEEIIITGTDFDEVNEVWFGTVAAVNPVITPTRITAVVPAGVTPGLQPIRVVSPDAEDTFDFTVVE